MRPVHLLLLLLPLSFLLFASDGLPLRLQQRCLTRRPSSVLRRAASPRIHVEYDTQRHPPIATNYDIVDRVDRAAKIHHVELWGKARGWRGWVARWLLRVLPPWWPAAWPKPKPCAKAGVRTHTSPMTAGLLQAVADDDDDGGSLPAAVGMLVYMWVHPGLRGQCLGDYLLASCCQRLRELRATHMLLVHDDDGSGRLVQYYAQRGYVPVFSVVDKGMVGVL